jgi:hypothetical protein
LTCNMPEALDGVGVGDSVAVTVGVTVVVVGVKPQDEQMAEYSDTLQKSAAYVGTPFGGLDDVLPGLADDMDDDCWRRSIG